MLPEKVCLKRMVIFKRKKKKEAKILPQSGTHSRLCRTKSLRHKHSPAAQSQHLFLFYCRTKPSAQAVFLLPSQPQIAVSPPTNTPIINRKKTRKKRDNLKRDFLILLKSDPLYNICPKYYISIDQLKLFSYYDYETCNYPNKWMKV